MRKRLDTRFPSARIKKIMQTDEDIGKIAMAVPLLVSKALELFLQDLCDRTYNITLKKGAKTVNSMHLKQCVQSFNTFDFLKDTVRRVPDFGGSDAVSDDKSATKRRKISEDEESVSGEVSKRTHTTETGHTNSSGRGRGRTRGRGRGRGTRIFATESHEQCVKSEDAPEVWYQNGCDRKDHESSSDGVSAAADLGNSTGNDTQKPVRNFDLNVDLNEYGEPTAELEEVATDVKTEYPMELVAPEVKTESSIKLVAPNMIIDSPMKPVSDVITDSSTKPAPDMKTDSSTKPAPDMTTESSTKPPPKTKTDFSMKLAPHMQYEYISGWSLDDMQKMAIDPIQLANYNGGFIEEDEDYDEE